MTTKNDPLPSIQARIEELQNTITEKEEKIKNRTRQLKDELETELSPVEFVRRHPFNAAGITFVAGVLLARALKGGRNTSGPVRIDTPAVSDSCSSQNKSALASIGFEVLRTAKDLGFTYLQRYIDKKIK
jgi:hypothetical protein